MHDFPDQILARTAFRGSHQNPPSVLQTSANVEVLGVQFGPSASFYGEFRTYSATLVGLGLSGAYSGTLRFICNRDVIAQAPLQPVAGLQVRQSARNGA